jgi:hypothetical protein
LVKIGSRLSVTSYQDLLSDRLLETGICQPEADVLFTEALRNLERISDHADNLGISVMRA